MRASYIQVAFKPRSRWSHGVCPQCRRFLATAAATITEGDRVLLYGVDPAKDPFLTKPLRREARIATHKGTIEHNGIVGKQVRDVVKTDRGVGNGRTLCWTRADEGSLQGRAYRIQLPTLADYVTLTPRRVTPIYPADANLIVSLLDIHAPISPSESRFEILEAGTGHGGLTLYLARAIHGFNASLLGTGVTELATREIEGAIPTTISDKEKNDAVETPPSPDMDSELHHWRTSRRAIIHTLDISAHNSAHAEQIVQGFRHGLYAGNVDFHVGDVSEWIAQELEVRAKSNESKPSKPFLAHVLLDLPMPEAHLESVASALRVDGALTVFNPSITQISACVEFIRKKKLPFVLDQVLELGSSMTGGREWSVRAVRPRASVRAQENRAKALENDGGESGSSTDASSEITRDQEQAQALASHHEDWAMICRPKVGGMISGGGFLGVWRRMRHRGEEDRSNVAPPTPDASPAE